MHVLIRKLSEYTANHLLLSVFRTVEEAEQGRCEYLQTVLHSPSDPWARQAYHDVSDNDVAVLSGVLRLGLDEAQDRVFVISSYLEGFGQVRRSFEAIAGSDVLAREHVSTLKANNDRKFPYYCDVGEVIVGELSYDPQGHHKP